MCWDKSEVQWAGDGLQNEDEAEKRRGEMVGEVPRCLTMKTAVHHDTHLVSNPLWHIQPMKLIVEEWRAHATWSHVAFGSDFWVIGFEYLLVCSFNIKNW